MIRLRVSLRLPVAAVVLFVLLLAQASTGLSRAHPDRAVSLGRQGSSLGSRVDHLGERLQVAVGAPLVSRVLVAETARRTRRRSDERPCGTKHGPHHTYGSGSHFRNGIEVISNTAATIRAAPSIPITPPTSPIHAQTGMIVPFVSMFQ